LGSYDHPQRNQIDRGGRRLISKSLFGTFLLILSICISPVQGSNHAASSDSLFLLSADSIDSKIEPLPILSYDSNTGFGFGAKSFFLNLLKLRESFDVIVFISTKGERWFRFVFSVPDFDLRQGKYYSAALDLIFDYDKWISYNYYGVGNETQVENNETYIRELGELSLDISRGFSPFFQGRASLKYTRIVSSGFAESGVLENSNPSVNAPLIEYTSVDFNMQYDLRNSYLHPSAGMLIRADLEWAPFARNIPTRFMRWSVWYHLYRELLFPQMILAWRLGMSSISAQQLPFQLLLALGGNQTLRGYPLGRFIDRTMGLTNIELRIPVYGRLGALLGADIGRVWAAPDKISFTDWHANLVSGLRYYLDTYIVRVDIGFSRESTGLSCNFNHIF
jgi:outer membrane protein assembly factor BamA